MERVRKSIFPPGPLSPIRHLSSVMEFSARKGKQIVILKLGTFFMICFMMCSSHNLQMPTEYLQEFWLFTWKRAGKFEFDFSPSLEL